MKKTLLCLLFLLCTLSLCNVAMADEMNWPQLQAAVNDAENGETITLPCDISARDGHTVLTIPSGKTVTIDLNGYRIFRNVLGQGGATVDGSAIRIEQSATLTVKDSQGGGRIHGGYATQGGGVYNAGTFYFESGRIGADEKRHANRANEGAGVYNTATGVMVMSGGKIDMNFTLQNGGGGISNYGTLTITGGSIEVNTAESTGGGISNYGTLTITGGSISGNTASGGAGGGIYVSKTAILNVSGMLQMTGNKYGSVTSNLNLNGGAVAHVTGDIDPSSQIGVSVSGIAISTSIPVATGLRSKDQAAFFFADNSSQATGAGATGEVLLGTPLTLTLEPGGGTGTMNAVRVAHSSEAVLPACSFDPPAGMQFDCWQIGSSTYNAGDSVTLTANQTAVAVWQSKWAGFQQQIDSAQDQAVLVLTEQLTAQSDDDPLVIPAGKTLTIDLKGCTIDRGLISSAADGNVITVNGALIIQDSEDGGTVTGGYSSGNGGGIVNNGTLTIEGGSIMGSRANYAGGVYNAAGAVFTMTGGSLTNNEAGKNGGGVVNIGEMTLTGGSISGNTASEHGGGVWTSGTLTVTGGDIADNIASTNSSNGQGGGICLDDGVLNLYGGTITGNHAKYGGGISEYESRVDALNIQGSPVVTGNTADTRGNNIRLYRDYTFTVTGTLTGSALLDVSPDSIYRDEYQPPYTLTNGLAGNGTTSNFVCDFDGFFLTLNDEGEVDLARRCDIIFVSGGGTGTMEGLTRADNRAYLLPEPGFTAPVGKKFIAWKVEQLDNLEDTDPYASQAQADTEITLKRRFVRLTAVWDPVTFGTPDFTLPADITSIEAEAFEGAAMSIVSVPDGCMSIGAHAFRNCPALTQIRIPAGCAVGEDVFDGCTQVYVFGIAGSSAEIYCSDPAHSNCVFIPM